MIYNILYAVLIKWFTLVIGWMSDIG